MNNAWRRIAERMSWSFLWREGQFLLNTVVKAGTVTVTRNSAGVVGVGTAFDATMIGRQFRTGTNTPIYTVSAVADATNLTLDRVWGGATASTQGYEIYNAYVTVPSDWHSFITVWDPRHNWQLHHNVGQDMVNGWDAQRTNSGSPPYLLAMRDYDTVSSPPLPRLEVWPHVKSEYVLPFIYEARATDLEDVGATLPRYIRGDVLLEGALAECARWPGPSKEHVNPYFNLQLAREHDGRFERWVAELQRQDSEVVEQDVRYQVASLPYAPIPSASWLQAHAI